MWLALQLAEFCDGNNEGTILHFQIRTELCVLNGDFRRCPLSPFLKLESIAFTSGCVNSNTGVGCLVIPGRVSDGFLAVNLESVHPPSREQVPIPLQENVEVGI